VMGTTHSISTQRWTETLIAESVMTSLTLLPTLVEV